MKKNTERLRRVANAIEASRNLILTCHEKPDGDAIGSMLGLGLALKDAGRDVILYSKDPIKEPLKFLPGSGWITTQLPDPLPGGTTLVILDCSEPGRIGPAGPNLARQADTIVVIDHHLDQDFCGKNGQGPDEGSKKCFQYVEPHIFATGALCLWIIETLGWPLTSQICTNLYTAILTDTGCFRHSNTTSLAFEMAAKLVRHGAEPYKIANHLYQSYPLRRMKLLALVLKTLEVKIGGLVGLIQVTPEMFRISDALEQDTDDFVAYARCIDQVEIAVFLKEVHPGHVSVSMRSKNFFNVAEIAKEFGGGGHFHAAGFRTSGTAYEIREALLDRLSKALKETSNGYRRNIGDG